jgi:hypothetical protein
MPLITELARVPDSDRMEMPAPQPSPHEPVDVDARQNGRTRPGFSPV